MSPSYRLEKDVLIFPNGVEKRPYSLQFDFLDTLDLPQEENGRHPVLEFVGLEELGLTYSSSTRYISGVPNREGAHELTLRLWTSFEPTAKPKEWKVRLLVNGDPRSKWRDLPTPDDMEYPTPNLQSSSLAWYTPRKLLAVSMRGRSHAHEGKPRDDSFQIGYIPQKDVYFLAVADGAGSATFSRKGSALACETVWDTCEKILPSAKNLKLRGADIERVKSLFTDTLCLGVAEAYKVVCAEAQEKGRLPRDYATTLQVALCKKVGTHYVFVTWWVGDGAMALYDQPAHEVFLLGAPDHGEYEGQTRFLTMPEIGGSLQTIRQRIRRAVVEDFTALFLMTDGISDPKFESDAALSSPEAWDTFLADLRGDNEEHCSVRLEHPKTAVSDLEQWIKFWARGSHDDRTLAMLF